MIKLKKTGDSGSYHLFFYTHKPFTLLSIRQPVSQKHSIRSFNILNLSWSQAII